MKIKVLSDLHLEFSEFNTENVEPADVLILAGDIAVIDELHLLTEETLETYPVLKYSSKYSRVSSYRKFFLWAHKNFKYVIYVIGNHEMYHGTLDKSLEHLKQELNKYNNFYVLEKDYVILDNIVFIGGTLWTDAKGRTTAIEQQINDYRLIKYNDRQLRVEDTVEAFYSTLEYLKQQLHKHKDYTCVVVTHHAPSIKSIHTKYIESEAKELNRAFYSDLDGFIEANPQIKLWVHGHTHNTANYSINSTQVVCNPRGYNTSTYSEETGFDTNLVIEI